MTKKRPANVPVTPPAPAPQDTAGPKVVSTRRPVTIFGLPLLPVTMEQALDEVDRLVQAKKPAYFITANLHYAMLSDRDERLAAVNEGAAFLLADGMPLVWWSKLRRQKLPERVAGSDLIYRLCERAAARGYRVFFLGGALGVADEAASKLCQRYPGLAIAGVESPPFKAPTPEENDRLVARVQASGADILLVALGQPKGEIWLHENCQALGVPACVQLGASLDFVAGRIQRAPRFWQRVGLEWAYRMFREPRRLAPRYLRDALFLAKALGRDFYAWCTGRPER
jgi:N-acetylglucosaminyldiphosphoundecaprenol N-acetyl-beta-D-mannosaminyltransferase